MNEPVFRGAPPEEAAEMQRYFDALPAHIQETMCQSGLRATSLEELQMLAKTMTNVQ